MWQRIWGDTGLGERCRVEGERARRIKKMGIGQGGEEHRGQGGKRKDKVIRVEGTKGMSVNGTKG
jgi:hypothetical protein